MPRRNWALQAAEKVWNVCSTRNSDDSRGFESCLAPPVATRTRVNVDGISTVRSTIVGLHM